MNSTKTERHSAPPITDDGTRVAYAEAATASRNAAKALEDALRDPALRPDALLGPEVTRNGETRRSPWSTRGVTAPRARRVLDYASGQYLAGYSKIEAGSRWTRSSGQAPHLPLIRQTCHALGLDGTKASNRSTIGAVYGYLDALGVLAYRPGNGPRYAYLAYGPVALAGRSLAAPAHRVSGGIPQQWGTGSTPAVGYPSRESIREKKSPRTAPSEPVAQSEAGVERDLSNTGKVKSNTSGAKVTRAGGLLLDALVAEVGKYGARYARRLAEEEYRDHGALIGQANKYGRLAEPHGESAYGAVIRALRMGEVDNLDKAESLPSTVAAIMGSRYESVAARYAAAPTPSSEPAYSGDPYSGGETYGDYHYGEEAEAVRAEEPVALRGALAHLADLTPLAPEPVGADPRTAVAVGAIAAGSAIAEVRPAYETEEPYRTRLIRDAVRRGQHLGYGISEEDAVALHAGYLDLRQAGNLDPERDLYEIQTALGRPLHLAEVALYGVSLRVSAAEWERAETSTYSGGAAVPEPVEVREVSLAGTAVAP
jgi:hypothetical protein